MAVTDRPGEPRPAVSVIVPARNAEATIGATLAALADQDLDLRYEVIVVDDCSDDRTAQIAQSAPGPVNVVRLPAPRHAWAARNEGFRHASAPVLALTDADCRPSRGWLAAGLRAVETADLVQGRVAPDPNEPVGPYDRSLWVTRDAGLHETANLFVRRPTWERVGGFEPLVDPGAGRPMAEDTWFGWRARRAGARLVFAPEALVHHAVFARGPIGLIAERQRLSQFPVMARQMPELRSSLFYARVFLGRRTAAFDLAVAAAGIALARRSWPWLVGTLPYVLSTAGSARPHGRRRVPAIVLVRLVADAWGLISLARGSVRARSPVL